MAASELFVSLEVVMQYTEQISQPVCKIGRAHV